MVAGEAQFGVEEFVDGVQHGLRASRRGDARAEFGGEIVEQRGVGLGGDVGKLGLRQQPRALLQIEVFAVLETEGHEAIVRGLPAEMLDDLAGVTAQPVATAARTTAAARHPRWFPATLS